MRNLVVVVGLLAVVGAACSDGDDPTPDGGADQGGGTDATGADGPTEAGSVEGGVTDGPMADGPMVDGPMVDGPMVDGPMVDGSGPGAGCGVGGACADGEVCLTEGDDKSCVAVGPPAGKCGGAKYPATLPADNDGTFHVDGSATGAGDGSQAKPFKTISAAMAAIPKGKKYTVAVADGVYDEQVTIGKRSGAGGGAESFAADLYCRCPASVRITGGVEVLITPLTEDLVVTIDGCNISPKGFDPDGAADWSCKGSSVGLYAAGGDAAFHVQLRDSVVAGWCTGVYFSAEPGLLQDATFCATRSRIAANVSGLAVQNAPVKIAQGAEPFAACKGLKEHLGLARNRFDHNKDHAVFTHVNARGIAFVANVVEKGGALAAAPGASGKGYGLYLGDTDSAYIESNLIRDNRNRGVGMRNEQAQVPFGIEINDNAVINNRGAGIALQKMQAKVDIRLTGNRVLGTKALAGEPGGDGIQVSVDDATEYKVDISDNIIDGSARNGLFYDGVAGSVDNNTVSNSGDYGCVLQQSQAVVGTNSWAGNASGDVHNYSSPVVKYGVMPVPIP